MTNEDIDLGHIDDEIDMLKQEVYEIAEYSVKLYKLLDSLENVHDEVDFPHWWQSKVVKARDYIGKATHYLDFEVHQLIGRDQENIEDTPINEKVEIGDQVRIKDTASITDPKLKGKSGYIKSINGKDIIVKLGVGRTIVTDREDLEVIQNIDEGKATCCGRCGRVHVKGTPCKKPYLSKNSPKHCQN